MSHMDALLYSEPTSPPRILFSSADDRTTIEAACLARRRGVATPLMLGSAEAAARVAPELDLDDIVFIDLTDAPSPYSTLDVVKLFIQDGVAHGAVFCPDVNSRQTALTLANGRPVSLTVFLETFTGAVVALTEDLGEDSARNARRHVMELVGQHTPVHCMDARETGDLHAATHESDAVVLSTVPDRDFVMCDLLRRYAGAAAYGPLLLGASIPVSFLRPTATVEDILGSLALLSTTLRLGEQEEARLPAGEEEPTTAVVSGN